MERIGIDQAAAEISDHCSGKRPPHTPYFFIVGAGLSASVLPQASRVIEMLRERAAASNRQIPPPSSEDPMTAYGHWFRNVLNSRGRQREFLEELMRNAEISAENLRLALLLIDGKIGNIVVTPNFDDFLSRALTLFGHRHVVSDNPYTSVRIRPESPEIQIVHVHGTYWFYDCANLEQDIVQRARPGDAGLTTTSDLLAHLLRNRSPIVIGYSGWEKDVIMSALAHRLRQHEQFPLEYPLYWCCYDEKDVERLPAIIRDHPNDDVRVVIPEALLSASGANDASEEAVPRSAEVLSASVISNATRSLAGEQGLLRSSPVGELAAARLQDEPLQRKLPARDVLSRLMLRVQVNAPRLLADPAGFLASHLRQSFPLSSSPSDIIWRLTVQRLERAQPSGAAGFNDHLAGLILDTLVSDFATTIQKGSQLDWRTASQGQLESYADLLHECASGIYQHQKTKAGESVTSWDQDDLTRIGYALAGDAYAALDQIARLDEERADKYRKSLYRHARVCDRLERRDEALASSRRLIDRFYDDTTGEAKLFPVCLSLLYLVADLYTNQSWDEALQILNKLEAKRVETDDVDLTALFARGSGLRGMLHLQRGNLTESENCFDELVRRYGENQAPQIQVVVAQSMTGRAQAFTQGALFDEALSLFREVIWRYASSQEDETISNVALAYAGAIRILAGRDEAEATSLADEAEQLIARGRPSGTLDAHLLLVRFNIAAAFVQQGKPEQAMAVADKVLESAAPVEAEQRMTYELIRLVKATSLIQAGREDAGAALFDDIIRQSAVGATPLNDLVRSVTMVEKANFLGRQGNQPAALELLREVAMSYRTSKFGPVRQLAARARWRRARNLAGSPATLDEAMSELAALQSDEALLSNEQARGVAAAAAVDRGFLAQKEGRIKEAIEAFEQLATSGADLTDLDTRLNVITAHWNAGFLIALHEEDFQRARPHYEEVVRRAEGLRFPTVSFYRALSLRALGMISALTGDMAKASDFFLQAEMGARDLQEPQRNDTLVSIRLAKGTALSLTNQAPEAIESLTAALDDAQSLVGQNVAVEVEEAFLRLAGHLLAEKDYGRAAEWSMRGIEWLSGAGRTLTSAHAQLTVRRAQALQAMDNDDDALAVAAELLQSFHEVTSVETRNAVDSVFDALVSKIIDQEDVARAQTLTKLFLTDLEPGIAPERELLAARVGNLSLAAHAELGETDAEAERLAWMKARLGESQTPGVQEIIQMAEKSLSQDNTTPTSESA